jgi:pyruvate dehydrogenase E2 component (dihydrolipoamide acetyltransferase)
MVKEVKVPDIGENVESGVVVNIAVSGGETVDVDQALIEIETDKAVVEIPSTETGKVVEITVKVDDEIKPGQVIAKIEVAGDAEEPLPQQRDSAPEEPEEEEAPKKDKPSKKEKATKKAKPKSGEEEKADKHEEKTVKPAPERVEKPAPKREEPPDTAHVVAPAAPSVRRLARELGADINRISGSGPGGRISSDDVKAYVKRLMTSSGAQEEPRKTSVSMPDFSQWGDITREKMSNVRGIIARGVGYAWQTVPHVTQFDAADITELEKFRKKYGEEVENTGGKLSVTVILIKILTAALRRFPRFNASIDVDNNEIIIKNYIHISVAIDTDRGLLVPVIRDADKKSIRELSVELTELAERTRNKKVKPEELEGGTFTISNQGSIGGTNFTPIVYWPQVAILGVSRSRLQPQDVSGHTESREILPLSLSYDHRIVDGADAARFLKWVVDALEHPLLLNLDG